MEEENLIGNEEQQQQQEEEIIQGDQDLGEEVQQSVEDPSYMYIESEQIDLTNHLLSGQIFFMGLIFGAIIFKIFWDRWRI